MWPWIRIGELGFPSFLLVQSLNAVFLLAWARSRAGTYDLPPRRALDFVFLVLVSGLAGGRLLHVIWEAPSYYIENPAAIFQLLGGGYVYFGGLISSLLAAFYFFRRIGENETGRWFDFAAPLASAGTAIGRVGCLLAGCCYGKICFLPWALPLTDERGLSFLRHPTPLYSILWEIGTLAILLGYEKTPTARRPRLLRASGSLFWLWLGLHSFGRFWIEFVRDDFRGPQYFLSVSQWLCLCALIGSCLVLRRNSPHPGDIPANPEK